MKTVYCTVGICSLLLLSCAKEIVDHTNDNEMTIESTVPPIMIDEFWSSATGIYQKYYDETDYVIQMNSIASPLESECITFYSGKRWDSIATKSASTLPHEILINGISTASRTAIRTKSSSHSDGLQALYGKRAKFEFVPTLTKSASEPIVVDHYIPEFVEITSPKITCPEELYPLCYVKGFVLRWNADPLNDNGLILCLEWFGDKLFGSDNNGQSVRRTLFIPEDNGEIRLDPKFFNHIPNSALIYLTLMRGNIENVLVDDYSYQIATESHVVLPIILIRKLREPTT